MGGLYVDRVAFYFGENPYFFEPGDDFFGVKFFGDLPVINGIELVHGPNDQNGVGAKLGRVFGVDSAHDALATLVHLMGFIQMGLRFDNVRFI